MFLPPALGLRLPAPSASREPVRRRLPSFFIEEPYFRRTDQPYYALQRREGRLITVAPILPVEYKDTQLQAHALRALLDQLFRKFDITRFVAWYYTPMALELSRHLEPDLTVYDCMDELSLFAGAPRLQCARTT